MTSATLKYACPEVKFCDSNHFISTLLWQLMTLLLTDYQTKQRLHYFGLNFRLNHVNNQNNVNCLLAFSKDITV